MKKCEKCKRWMGKENQSAICRRCVTAVYLRAMITHARRSGGVLATLAATLRLLRHQLAGCLIKKKRRKYVALLNRTFDRFVLLFDVFRGMILNKS